MIIDFYNISNKKHDLIFAFIDNECLEKYSNGGENKIVLEINTENSFNGDCDKCTFYDKFDEYIKNSGIELDHKFWHNYELPKGNCGVIGVNAEYSNNSNLLKSVFGKYIGYLNEHYSKKN